MGPCLCGDTECPWCGPMQGGPMRDEYDNDTIDWIPDPETPYNCDVCGCVLPRGHKDFYCDNCAEEIRAMKETREWKYPYARED